MEEKIMEASTGVVRRRASVGALLVRIGKLPGLPAFARLNFGIAKE
jgi:hypothetical protein